MSQKRRAADVIKELVVAWRSKSDEEVLSALAALPALADENDPCWTEAYWDAVAYPYLALADLAGERRLRAAIRLLERACFGDPGEIMRGLRNTLEAIVAPEWDALAEACLAAARSERPGTRLWALDELAMLDDPRAKPLFEAALQDESSHVRMVAWRGWRRVTRREGAAGQCDSSFGRAVLVLHEGKWGSRYSANLELGNSWQLSADQEIRRLVSLVRGLPPPARRLWNGAQSRVFNIGLQAGLTPRAHELTLSHDTIAGVASVQGRIAFTTYAPDSHPLPAPPSRKSEPPHNKKQRTKRG